MSEHERQNIGGTHIWVKDGPTLGHIDRPVHDPVFRPVSIDGLSARITELESELSAMKERAEKAEELARIASDRRHVASPMRPPPGHITDDTGASRLVLGTFTLTKDGAIVAGTSDLLWHPDYEQGGKLGAWGCSARSCRFYFTQSPASVVNPWRDLPISECYSTKQAAEKAGRGE